MAAPALGAEANKTEPKHTCSCLDFCAAPGRPHRNPNHSQELWLERLGSSGGVFHLHTKLQG